MLLNKAKEAESHFKLALARRPGDPAYQLALGLLYLHEQTGKSWPPAERDALMSQAFDALGNVAQTPVELNTAAIYYLIKTTAARALPFAERASRGDPDCWSCLHTYAAATFLLGRAAEAAELERSALERLPDDAPSKVTAVLTRDRARYLRAASSGSKDDRQDVYLFWPD
jgi:tetratricopeptide (TPR) repeat protein